LLAWAPSPANTSRAIAFGYLVKTLDKSRFFEIFFSYKKDFLGAASNFGIAVFGGGRNGRVW